jgi:hypothetical protein
MILILTALAMAEAKPADFPERTPSLIERCLFEAIEGEWVSEEPDSYKYICSGSAAEVLWTFLEKANIESYEQDVGADGHWLSRDSPLGGCFKRTRLADGSPAKDGLSCTIWIPRKTK